MSHINGDTYAIEHVHDPTGSVYVGQTYCSITFAANAIASIDHMAQSKHRGPP